MVIGTGFAEGTLSEIQVRECCREAFGKKDMNGKKVLVIIPDLSRTAPIDMMFPILYDELAEKVDLLDFIIAAGTHTPLTDDEINRRVGITQADRSAKYPKVRFFNHHWTDPDQLQVAGTITADKIAEISGGLMA